MCGTYVARLAGLMTSSVSVKGSHLAGRYELAMGSSGGESIQVVIRRRCCHRRSGTTPYMIHDYTVALWPENRHLPLQTDENPLTRASAHTNLMTEDDVQVQGRAGRYDLEPVTPVERLKT